MNEDLKKLKEDYETKKKELFAEMKVKFVEHSKALFDKYPLMMSFGMPCYTPYFNDGEPCTWEMNDDSEQIYVNDIQGCWADDHAEEEDKAWMFKQKRHGKVTYYSQGPVYDDCADFFGNLPEDFYEDAFKEGLITIYRDGTIKVKNYDHD